jgi:amino acid transporter
VEAFMDKDNSGFFTKIKRRLIGSPRNILDPSIFHKISLVPLLAWIGLGADGLSSSSYGPEEAFRAFGEHTYLALFLAFAMAFTVFVISYAYSRIIEHFPHGGGGYIVATHMLGKKAGVVSGSALLVDYILTITISIAAAADALFSFMPAGFFHFRLLFAIFLVIFMIILNIRGVKESITILAPIFIAFIITHAILLGYGIFSHANNIGVVIKNIHSGLKYDLGTIGLFGVMAIFLHGYSLGGGTYTGIEAVSNGLQVMREPHVKTGQRTMIYMATSLALTASGILLCYLLWQVKYIPGKTMNAVLAATVMGKWAIGPYLAFLTIFAEGALLILAAQAGFVDGPRVMSNMAVDYWMPHRFASLSDRLTMQNGIMVMGISAVIFLILTRGSVSALVVMYSINVFLTFSMSEFGMSRFFFMHRKTQAKWKRHISIHLIGLILCLAILIITVLEKFRQGAWITLVITAAVIAFCLVIKGHYESVKQELQGLDETLLNIPTEEQYNGAAVDPMEMTAIQLVSGYNGFGVHTFLSITRNFPGTYKNFIFLSVAVVDSGTFKGQTEIENLKDSVRQSLERYVELARRFGFAADYRMVIGTDVVENAVELCGKTVEEFPRSVVFAGQLTFSLEKFYHRFLHNETAFSIQRRLHWQGITSVILPIRVGIKRTG